MPELTERARAFQAAIADFVGNKLKKLPKDKDGNYAAASALECKENLSSYIEGMARLQITTHILKATHPQANGSDWHNLLRNRDWKEIGTHSVAQLEEDITGGAALSKDAKFLRTEIQGRRVLDWIRDGDQEFQSALHENPDTAREWMQTLRNHVKQKSGNIGNSDKPDSDWRVKQVYWLADGDPRSDSGYHLLQPMFPSSLVHAVHADIQNTFFGEVNVEARKAYQENKPFDRLYRKYQGLALRQIGGDHPENVSALNSERRGRNDLLASLPPPAWNPPGLRMLARDSAFAVFLYFGNVRELVKALGEFLASDPAPTMETRQQRESLEQELGLELAAFGAAVRNQQDCGWTRDARCQLPRHQQLWMDPERALPEVCVSSEHPEWQADDEAFSRDFHRGDWADQVAGDFGLWLNAQLRQHDDKLKTLGETEMRHFARQAVIEAAWPMPMQRRAPAGDAA